MYREICRSVPVTFSAAVLSKSECRSREGDGYELVT